MLISILSVLRGTRKVEINILHSLCTHIFFRKTKVIQRILSNSSTKWMTPVKRTQGSSTSLEGQQRRSCIFFPLKVILEERYRKDCPLLNRWYQRTRFQTAIYGSKIKGCWQARNIFHEKQEETKYTRNLRT